MFSPLLYLPMIDGTKRVFCEGRYKRRNACNGFMVLSNGGTVITGNVVVDNRGTLYFCSEPCIVSHFRSK